MKRDAAKSKIMPRSLGVALLAGAILYLAYLTISLTLPGWDIDSRLGSIPKWLSIPAFTIMSLYLLADFVNSVFGIFPGRRPEQED